MDHAAFLKALTAGDLAAVEAALADRPSLAAARDASGLSAVLLALYHGHRAVADAVLAAGPPLDVFGAAAAGVVERVRELLDADPALANAYAPDGLTPLGLAAFFKRRETARLLVARGADVNQFSRHASIRVAPLHSALADRADEEIAALLVAAGAEVNARASGEGTPLHTAAFEGSLEVVRLLLASGAELTATDDRGRTPLMLARERGHAAVAEALERAAASPGGA